MDCIFCKIINKEIPCYSVYEDDDFLAFLDIAPINKGHTLVIPKNHQENIFELSDDLASKYFVVVKNLAKKIKDGVGADGINIGMNNLKDAGQVVMHSHVHIIPRFSGDGLEHWGSKEISKEEMIDLMTILKK